MDKTSVFLAIFVALFLFSLAMSTVSYIGGSLITGHATSGTTTSNVTITKAFAITLSANLSAGIQFGNISTSTASNANATSNYDGASSTSTYFVNNSDTSTINVDVCINGNADLTDPVSLDIIGLGNESYANATTSSSTVPAVADEVSLTTTATKAGEIVQPGFGNYFRFWLDLPSNIPSGTYNNTLTFLGIEQGDSCT